MCAYARSKPLRLWHTPSDSIYLKVTKFSDTLNLAILAFSFFPLNLVHTKPLKCAAN